MMSINIVTVIKVAEVPDAVHKTYSKKDHHAKPHGHMKVKVADGFVQNKKVGHIQQETTDNGVNQQAKRYYFPPAFIHNNMPFKRVRQR